MWNLFKNRNGFVLMEKAIAGAIVSFGLLGTIMAIESNLRARREIELQSSAEKFEESIRNSAILELNNLMLQRICTGTSLIRPININPTSKLIATPVLKEKDIPDLRSVNNRWEISRNRCLTRGISSIDSVENNSSIYFCAVFTPQDLSQYRAFEQQSGITLPKIQTGLDESKLPGGLILGEFQYRMFDVLTNETVTCKNAHRFSNRVMASLTYELTYPGDHATPSISCACGNQRRYLTTTDEEEKKRWYKVITATGSILLPLQISNATGTRDNVFGLADPALKKFFLFNTKDTKSPIQVAFNIPDGQLKAISGDWDGDGRDGVGFYRYTAGTGYFHLKNLFTANSDISFSVSGVQSEWIPVVAPLYGGTKASYALYSPMDGKLYIKRSPTSGDFDQAIQLWTYETLGGTQKQNVVGGIPFKVSGGGAIGSVGIYQKEKGRICVVKELSTAECTLHAPLRETDAKPLEMFVDSSLKQNIVTYDSQTGTFRYLSSWDYQRPVTQLLQVGPAPSNFQAVLGNWRMLE